MLFCDPIYGKFKIKEPVLTELIKSLALQRLKKISQYGVPDPYYHLKNFYRYEHSLGVMILLRQLGAGLEEQIAGLIHDVSHLAFSHVADWALADGIKGQEVYQDTIHTEFIKRTKIPGILKKYGYKLERIVDYHNFTLLEKELPDICADRIDYALREMFYWQSPNSVPKIVGDLIVYTNQIVFNNLDSAYSFAKNYLLLQTIHWGGYEAMMRYFLFSQIIKIAIKEKIIRKDDLFGYEKPIITKLEKSQQPIIIKYLKILSHRQLPKLKLIAGQKIVKKFRYVNPKILANNSLCRLTDLRPSFTKVIARHKKINSKGLVI